jgi:hypothetical protein
MRVCGTSEGHPKRENTSQTAHRNLTFQKLFRQFDQANIENTAVNQGKPESIPPERCVNELENDSGGACRAPRQTTK